MTFRITIYIWKIAALYNLDTLVSFGSKDINMGSSSAFQDTK